MLELLTLLFKRYTDWIGVLSYLCYPCMREVQLQTEQRCIASLTAVYFLI